MPNVRCGEVPAVPAAEPAVLQAAGDLWPLTIRLRAAAMVLSGVDGRR